jgi:hypothetical protein
MAGDNLDIVNTESFPRCTMAVMTAVRHIAAPPDVVFALASDFAGAPGRIKGIVKVEILTPGPVGVGTRFRETRVMFGKEAPEEMELATFDPGKSYELPGQSCGAEYRSTFRFVPDGGGTRLELEFHARAVTFFAKLMTPLSWLMKGMIKKCIEQDMDDLKQAAEATAPAKVS